MIWLVAVSLWVGLVLLTWALAEWGPTYVPKWMTKDLSRKKKT